MVVETLGDLGVVPGLDVLLVVDSVEDARDEGGPAEDL